MKDSGALTYEPYFGLQEKPFSLSPDPRFFFSLSSHGATFAALLAGIRRREGIMALTGEVGTGKTTLCRAVLQSLDRNTVAAFVPDPFLSREDLLKILLVEFGIVSMDDIRSGRLRGASRTDLCYPLYEFLTSLQPLQSFAVMMIDEAQNLSSQLLEEIRILADLENRQKLLQVVLVGQPELQTRLGTPEMRQLSQRLSVRCELLPLERQDIGPYISHRLAIAGNNGALEFGQVPIELVWRASSGIPRVINLVCDRALLRAARAGRATVDTEDVVKAADDLKLPITRGFGTSLERPAPAFKVDLDRPTSVPERGRRHDEPKTDRRSAFVTDSIAKKSSHLVPAATPAAMSSRAVLFGNQAGDALLDISQETVSEAGYEESSASGAQRRIRLLTWVAMLATTSAVVWYLASLSKVSPRPGEAEPPSQAASRLAAPASSAGPSARDDGPKEVPTPGVKSGMTSEPPLATGAAPGNPETTQISAGRFVIQMATFQSAARAAQAARQFADAGYRAYNTEIALRDGGSVNAVFLGPYAEIAVAERDLQRAGQVFGYGDGLIVHNPVVAPPSTLRADLPPAAPKPADPNPAAGLLTANLPRPAPTPAGPTPPAALATPNLPPASASPTASTPLVAPATPDVSASAQKPAGPTTAAALAPPNLPVSPPRPEGQAPPVQTTNVPREAPVAARVEPSALRDGSPTGLATPSLSDTAAAAPRAAVTAVPAASDAKPGQMPVAKFAIQMGTFRNAAVATHALQELHDAGYHAYSAELSQRDGGSALAVFLGPYADLAPAERDLQRAQQIPGYSDEHIVQFGGSTPPAKPGP